MFCNHGSWVFDDGSEIQKIECVTTKYIWRYLWIFALLIMFVVWLRSQCAAPPKTGNSAKQEVGQDLTTATQNAGDSVAPVSSDAAAISATASDAPTTSGTTAPTGAAPAAPAVAPDASPDAQPVAPQ